MLFCDLWRYVPRGFESKGLERAARFLATMFLHPGWLVMFHFRIAQMFYRWHLYPLGWLFYRWNMFLFASDIHPSVRLGPGAWLPHPLHIVIARDARIGKNVTVYQNVTIGGRGDPPVLGDSVVIGAGAVVLGPAVLGDRVQVGANAVVTKSFPADCTVVGAPARVMTKEEKADQ